MGSADFALVGVPPIGTRETRAFVTYSDGRCGPHTITLHDYPEPEFDLRQYRRDRDLGLRDCAKLLGLRASEVSGLERGSLRPETGWDVVRARLEASLTQLTESRGK